MKILPAILEQSIDSFWQSIKNLYPYFSHFQIDIADNKFVKNKTIQIEKIIASFSNFQLSTANCFFDFHLMVFDYQTEIVKLKELEKSMQIENVLIHLKVIKPDFKAENYQFKLGIVLNPEDKIKPNYNLIKNFPAVQIMSVNPGFQGAEFLPEVLTKINELRNSGYQGKIFLDGGINDKTLPVILKNPHKSDVLCVGSYLKTDTKERVKKLKKLIG